MLIHINNFYQEENALFIRTAVSELDFKPQLYGKEILDFYMVPEGIDSGFSSIIGQQLNIKSNSGVFRIPYPVVHFESFDTNNLFVGAVSLENCVFRTHKHKETGSISVTSVLGDLHEFVTANCFDSHKWESLAEISMQTGDLVLFRPWLWHSFEEKLIKVFYLEVNKCENAANVGPAAKDGSSEMHME